MSQNDAHSAAHYPAAGWYIKPNGGDSTPRGPFKEPQLRKMVASGDLSGADFIGECHNAGTPPTDWLLVSGQRWLTRSKPLDNETGKRPALSGSRRIDISETIKSAPRSGFIRFAARRRVEVWKALIGAIVAGFAIHSLSDQAYALGILYAPSVLIDHQIWRMITCVFMHGNLLHLAFNLWALYVLGRYIEAFYGPNRFLLLFILSGIGGSAFSMAGHSEPVPSLGASGAIFGLIGALFAPLWRGGATFRFDGQLGAVARAILPWIAINFAFGIFVPTMRIDNYGHFGGLVVGFIAARTVGLQLVADPKRDLKKSIQAVIIVLLIVIAALFITSQRAYMRDALANSTNKGESTDSKLKDATTNPEPKRRVPPDRARRVDDRPALSPTSADVSPAVEDNAVQPAITALPVPEPVTDQPETGASNLDTLAPRMRAIADELNALTKTLKEPMPINEKRALVNVWHRIRFAELEANEETPASAMSIKVAKTARRARELCERFGEKISGEPAEETVSAATSDALFEAQSVIESLTGH
ncbi:MAG: rhomboid family intramembrane serine protease [Planctomycetota bacterium]